MPSNDLILNVRQIANYPSASGANSNDAILIQQGGLGGPYASIQPQDFVVSALFNAKSVTIQGDLTAYSLQGGNVTASNAIISALSSQNASIFSLNLGGGSINGDPLATQGFVGSTTVSSVNGRRGDVVLGLADIVQGGGAPIYSPVFQGVPQAPTAFWTDVSSQIATTAFVAQAVSGQLAHLIETQPFVYTFNGRSGQVVLTAADLTSTGVLNDIVLTGNPTAPTPSPGDNSDSIATTAFVTGAGFAPLNSPAFTGLPTGPTASPGTNTGQLATTAFVMQQIAAATTGVATFNGRTGHVVLSAADVSSAGGALTASPAFTGVPVAPTAAPGTNTPQIATTAFVMNAVGSGGSAGVSSFNTRTGAVTLAAADISAASGALLASPAFTGNPTAPTAAPGNNSTAIATTAFVAAAITAAGGVASFNGRTGAITLTGADVSSAGGALTTSPTFTGTPSAPTAAPGNSSTQLATTAFVQAAITSGTAGVSSFNSRTGAVVLTGSDISTAGGALLSSPAFTGSPTAPTATAGTSTTQLATTAFVAAALTAAGAGVSSFNTRTGAVTLSGADISAAGGALLAGPTFTGVPAAPTASPGTSTTQLATTAFVAAALLAGGGVSSFNTRTGAVTLTQADITGANGAILASPAFTGSPTAPTAAGGTNNTQIATTGFVAAAVPAPATVAPNMDGTAAVGTSVLYARQDHTHPTNTATLSTATGGTVSGPVDLKVQSVTAAATTAVNRANGENVALTLGMSITTLTVSGWPASGFTGKLRLVIVSSGAFTIAWPAGTKWAGGTAPTLTSSGTDIVILMTDNAGTTIYGSVVGQAYA